MNIAKLFVGTTSGAELTHVSGSSARVTRTSEVLRANVAKVGAALLELGIRAGDAVMILGASRVEIAEAILATFNVGAVAVPVSPLLGPAHLNSIVERLRPRCCIFEDPPVHSVQGALAACGSAMIALKANAESIARGWPLYRDIIARSAAPLTFPEHARQHPALIVHGSGSTGALKAVVMSHEDLLTFMEYNRLVFAQYSDGPDALTTGTTLVTCLPVTHLAGLGNTLLGLMNGARTFILSSFLPEPYLRLVEEVRCPHILLVPSLYRSLLKEPYLKAMDKSALRFCIIGGEPSPEDLLLQISNAFGVPVATVYSMTECLSGIAHHRRDLVTGIKPGSCGRPFFGEVSLRDSQGHEQHESGELWVRNATVRACYTDPALNEERLFNGWFKTGDLFSRDEDGDYFHRGRVDDMFVCNGKNVYPIEIESLLSGHPAVEMACAAPVALPGKGPVPAVLIVAKAQVTEAELQAYCMQRGASHAVPQVIRFVASLPLLGPGKIDRQHARQLLQQPYANAS